MFMNRKMLTECALSQGYELINKEYKNELELKKGSKIITIHTDDFGRVTVHNVTDEDDELVLVALSYSFLPLA